MNQALEIKLCKNCNSELVGLYCSECGQKKIENFTFTELVKDFFDNIFSLDSRLYQTLKFLIIRPGFLTNEYWSGKRIKYLPPFRLYLLTSILFFFIPNPDYQYGAEEFYPLLQKGMFVLMPCVAFILLIIYRGNIMTLVILYKIFGGLHMLMGVVMGLGFAALPEAWVPSDGITTMAEHFGSALLVVGFMFWMMPSWTSAAQLKKATMPLIGAQVLLVLVPL